MNRALDKLINHSTPTFSGNAEGVGVSYKSEVIDTIYHNDGTKEVIEHGHNVMLNDFLKIVTGLLKDGSGRLNYWAIGTGDSSWGKAGKREEINFTVTSACTKTGFIKLTLNGYTQNVDVTEGDTTETVATKITSSINNSSVAGIKGKWTVTRNGSSINLIYAEEKNLTGTHQYLENSTGAICNGGRPVDVIDGSSSADIPAPSATDTGLVHEVFRKPIATSAEYPEDGIFWVNASGSKSASPTNILEVRLTFTPSEGIVDGQPTEWREFGIVSGGTEILGSGLFMNLKRHNVITKTSGMTVERKIRFTFTNANN